jgi:hypothetical protein
MLTLSIVGSRVVFAMPLDLRANWVFRIASVQPGRKTLAAARRALITLSAVPIWLAATVLCFSLWPWRQAAGHVLLLGFIGLLLVDLCLHGFRKIPFTCSYLPGKSQVHMVFLGALGLFYFILLSVKYERDMLLEAGATAAMLLPFCLAALGVRLWTTLTDSGDEELQFEEAREPAVLELGLHRDGVMPLGPPADSPPMAQLK